MILRCADDLPANMSGNGRLSHGRCFYPRVTFATINAGHFSKASHLMKSTPFTSYPYPLRRFFRFLFKGRDNSI